MPETLRNRKAGGLARWPSAPLPLLYSATFSFSVLVLPNFYLDRGFLPTMEDALRSHLTPSSTREGLWGSAHSPDCLHPAEGHQILWKRSPIAYYDTLTFCLFGKNTLAVLQFHGSLHPGPCKATPWILGDSNKASHQTFCHECSVLSRALCLMGPGCGRRCYLITLAIQPLMFFFT